MIRIQHVTSHYCSVIQAVVAGFGGLRCLGPWCPFSQRLPPGNVGMPVWPSGRAPQSLSLSTGPHLDSLGIRERCWKGPLCCLEEFPSSSGPGPIHVSWRSRAKKLKTSRGCDGASTLRSGWEPGLPRASRAVPTHCPRAHHATCQLSSLHLPGQAFPTTPQNWCPEPVRNGPAHPPASCQALHEPLLLTDPWAHLALGASGPASGDGHAAAHSRAEDVSRRCQAHLCDHPVTPRQETLTAGTLQPECRPQGGLDAAIPFISFQLFLQPGNPRG